MSDSKAALRREVERLEREQQQDRQFIVDLLGELADLEGKNQDEFWPNVQVKAPQWYWRWVL